MVGASKLSELIYRKEVPSNDSSPYHSHSPLSLHYKQRSFPPKCCSTDQETSRCHGTHRQNILLEDERDEEARRKSGEAINNKKNRGSKYCTSSSEVSVKTVIYRGGSKKNIVSAGGEKERDGDGGGGEEEEEEVRDGELLISSSPSSNGSHNLPRHHKIYSSTDSPTFHHRQTFKFMNDLRSSHEKCSSTLQPVIKSLPCGRKYPQNQQQQVMCTVQSYDHHRHHTLTTHPNLHHDICHQHNGRNLEELHNFCSTSSRKHLFLDCIKRNDLKLDADSYLVRRRRRKVGRGKGEEEEEEGEDGEEVAFQDFDRIYRSIDRGNSSSVRKRRNRRRSRSWRERAKSNELWVDGPLCRDNNSSSNKPSTSIRKKKEQPHNLSSQDRRKILDVENLEKHERIQDWIQQHTKQIWSDILTATSTSSTPHRARLLQNKPDFSPRNQSPEEKQVSMNGINDVTQFSTCCEGIIEEIDGKRIFGPSSNASCQIDTKPLKDDHGNDDHKSPIHETFYSLSNDNCFYGNDIIRSIDPGHETDPGHLMSEESEADDGDRDAISECYCRDRGSPSLFDDRSELSTEPLGMLKLEQFLKKLIEVTAPIKEDLKENSKKEVKCNGGGVEEEKSEVSSSNNYSTEVSDTVFEGSRNKSNRDCDQLLPVTLSMLNNEVLELQKVQVGFTGPQLPTSPRVNRLIATGNNGPMFPVPLSPAHSSKKSATLSRCSSGTRNRQHRGMQQKRNTTSTTTSGHGTTSEGESNSSGAKESSSKGSSVQTPSPVTKSKPASSGYDSTINDDESDHRTMMHQVRNNHTNQTVSNVPNNNESMVRLRDKESKSIMKRQKKKRDATGTIGTVASNDPKRESVSSETSSIVCCKFFC